jgi:DNA polymerase-1
MRPGADREGPVYLIDASVFVFRAYHSVPVALADRDGNPVNALHGFARFLCDLLERVTPEHIGVAFDQSLSSSFRHRLYPAYKANRERAPEELRRQFLLCRELCRALGIWEFASSEYEADDIIGTLAVQMRLQGRAVVLVTRDKDLAQLIRPGDHYWDYTADTRYIYDDIPQRFGVRPERMADFLALMGDAVDNIPGVPGVGRKTASMLLAHFESLDHLYENIDSLTDTRAGSAGGLKLRNAPFVAAQLKAHRESAFLARQLTGIACDMPLGVCLEDLRRRALDMAVLNAFYDGVGFGRLLRNQAERIAQRRPADTQRGLASPRGPDSVL